MLSVFLHAPRGPFYSPKVARSRWEHSRKAILAFCRLAHRTVQCTPDSLVPPSDRWVGHVSRADRATDRWLTGQSGAHRTVRWMIVVCRWSLPESSKFAWASLAHRTLSGAPPDSPVHPDRADFGWTKPSLISTWFSCFQHLATIH
jgi:hypothetical protein